MVNKMENLLSTVNIGRLSKEHVISPRGAKISDVTESAATSLTRPHIEHTYFSLLVPNRPVI